MARFTPGSPGERLKPTRMDPAAPAIVSSSPVGRPAVGVVAASSATCRAAALGGVGKDESSAAAATTPTASEASMRRCGRLSRQAMAESGSIMATTAIFTSSTRPYAVSNNAEMEPSWVIASSPPATTVVPNAASATGVNLASSTRASTDRHPPGGCTRASAAIPPAQRPAARRWIASRPIPYQAGSTPAACPPAASSTSAPATHIGSVLEPRTTATSARTSTHRRAINTAPERPVEKRQVPADAVPP